MVLICLFGPVPFIFFSPSQYAHLTWHLFCSHGVCVGVTIYGCTSNYVSLNIFIFMYGLYLVQAKACVRTILRYDQNTVKKSTYTCNVTPFVGWVKCYQFLRIYSITMLVFFPFFYLLSLTFFFLAVYNIE